MPLVHRSMKSNEVRAPEVPRGEVIMVGRYTEANTKVALVNPEDLAMLEDAYDILQAAGETGDLALDDLTRKSLAVEDRPDARSIEDPATIAAILEL